ncbi:hypothetical protein [Roseovarius sp. D0-M9]|uniref:hypothetical protein n=1 Tax=Roseovarius sp. D0-M9 TaxID=3127117 RepID=UPI00300FDFBD
MFMGLKDRKLVSGKSFPATLVFERAGEVEIEFVVETRPTDAGESSDHGDMDHSSH